MTQAQTMLEQACPKCPNTGWCHGTKECDLSGLPFRATTAAAQPIAWLYEADRGSGYWSEHYTSTKPAGNKYQRNIRPLYATPSPLPAPGEAQRPFAWTIPGPDQADCNGFIEARISEEGEFTKPLYAEPRKVAPGEVAGGGASKLLEAEAARYSGETAVYTGNHVSNILATQATRVRLATLSPGGGTAEEIEPDELEALIADRSANRAADAILKEFVVTRRAALSALPPAQADGVALKAGEILGIKQSLDRDLSERQIPETFQQELRALRLAVSRPDRGAATS